MQQKCQFFEDIKYLGQGLKAPKPQQTMHLVACGTLVREKKKSELL